MRKRSFSQFEVDLLIDTVINNPTAAKGRVKRKRSRSGVALCCTRLNCCNQQMLNFELKTRGCIPGTRN